MMDFLIILFIQIENNLCDYFVICYDKQLRVPVLFTLALPKLKEVLYRVYLSD